MTSSVQRRYSFEAYLRAGRLVSPDNIEHKFNPNHDPENGRFTFAEAGSSRGGADAPSGHGGAERAAPRPTVTYKKTKLTPAEYNAQAASLWSDMGGQEKSGLKNDHDIQVILKRVGPAADQAGSADVEAPEDVRRAVISIAHKTVSSRLRGNQSFEKAITFERDDNQQVIVASLGLPGPQGGSPPGITHSTIAVAHVHYSGLIQKPDALDYTGARSGIPTFVMAEETGILWEIGRQKGKYVQRIVHLDGSAGKWASYGR